MIAKDYNLADIKLVALDIDGTLIDDDLQVSSKTKKAIKDLIHKNIHVALVTGRPYRAADSIRKKLGVDIPIVAHNGGKVIIPSQGEVLNRKIPLTEARKVIRGGEKRDLYMKVYTDDVLYIKERDEASLAFSVSHDIEYKVVGKLSENIHRDVNMIVIFYKDPSDRIIEKELKDIGVTITTSTPGSIEAIPKGISKKEGLKVLAKHLGIHKGEILAIGNSMNDFEMLRYVGVGIAMKNSDRSLLSKWDSVTEYTNNEEGVYHIIKHIS